MKSSPWLTMKKMIKAANRTQRIRTIDIARGIAIFSIIVGHFGIYSVVRVVFCYHVPIFYIITGYLMKKENYCSFVKRKMQSLIIPYYVTCITIVILQGIAALVRGSNFIGTLWYWSKAGFYGAGGIIDNLPDAFPPIGAVWFLLAIFWGSLLMQLVLRCSIYLQFPIVAVLFFFGYVSAHKLMWFPFDIQPGCCAVLYMYVGYLAKYFEDRIEKWRKQVWPAAFLVWAIFAYSFTSFYLVSCDYGNGLFDIVASICACYCIFIIAERLDCLDGEAVEIIAFFGRYSLVVLCVHLVEMNLIDWWMVVDRLQIAGISRIIGCLIAVCIKIMFIIGGTILVVRIRDNK